MDKIKTTLTSIARQKKTKKHKTNSNSNSNSNSVYLVEDYNKKHQYFIINCHDKYDGELNANILGKYFQRLGVSPDPAMKSIANMDFKHLLDRNVSKTQTETPKDIKYCKYFKTHKQPEFDPSILLADIFIYSYTEPINKRFYSHPIYLANIFNTHNTLKFTNKQTIIKLFKDIHPDWFNSYIPETFKINDLARYKFPKWYILRPIYSRSGQGVFYISSQSELDDKIAYYHKTKNEAGKLFANNVIASEFVTDLMLFQEKKFHLRIFLLISYTNGILNSFLLKFAEIITAKEKFNLDLPFTKEKHDTNWKATEKDFFLPRDFTNANLSIHMTKEKFNIMWEHITNICKMITQVFEMNKNKLLLDNQQNGYHIYGLDLLIRNDLTPVFIECNTKPGYGCNGIDCDYRINQNYKSKIIYKWINDTVLEPLIRYNDPLKARIHKTYISI
jgi:hypothetical protein